MECSAAPEWISTVKGFIIDMDGVLYRGSQAIPEAKPFLAALDELGIPYMMATNNATQTPDNYAAKLESMSIAVRPEQVFTSALATANYLRSTYEPGTSVFVVGMTALKEAVYADGYFIEDGAQADVVVSGADFELRYESLRVACLAIRAGADYVATNADTTFPTPQGLVPGSGAIVAALVASGGTQPVVVGKPSPVMVERCLDELGLDPLEAVMLGDRLDTDILAGIRAGTRTVLVTTGISNVADIETFDIRPDWTIPTLDALTVALLAVRR